MSDSDDELLSNSVFNFPNDGSTIISARGPDIEVNFALPRTLAPPRYPESNYERQRHKRDMSPMSVASACDARFRTFNNSYYPGAMSSQRSVCNWRSGSPMSTRTCDTNTTLTATDIAQALINPKFSKRDARIINKAISRWKEMDKYKRIEKRRKQRMFLQRNKRLSYDSGEQASLSSSSDDNQSTKIIGYRKNMSSCRSTKTDISDFRRTIQESNNFRHNSSRNFLNRPALNSTLMSMNSVRNMTRNCHEMRNKGVFVFGNQPNYKTQRERFQNGFPLPSQRFDKSIATSTIQETERHHVDDTDRDDNIFSINKSKAPPKRKRSIDEENAVLANNKRPRVVSPCENSTKTTRAKEMDNTNMLTKKSNEFVFAKPSLPIRKPVKEKLISQSAPPLPEIMVSEFIEKQPINKKITKDNEEIPHNITQSTDVSMRPSFIKRKLFTQKLDVAENKNVSSENLAPESPQGSIYSAIQKEKHKARKLVTNQSCLNREIHDDSNLLELIHKIVPPNSMNITTQSNKTEIQSTKNKTNSDKWDISSIISMKDNDDDCSDTFTDEDLLNGDTNNTVKEIPSEKKTKSNLQKNNEKASNFEKAPSKEKLVSKKVPSNDPISDKLTSKDKVPESDKVTKDKPISDNVTSKAPGIKKYVHRFWDTDYESDGECLKVKRNNLRENDKDIIKPPEKVATQLQGVAAITKKPNAIADASIISMTETTQRFNATSFKIKSHRSLKPKKFCDDNKENTLKSYFEPLNKKQKSNDQIQTDTIKCDDNIETLKNNINTATKQREIKVVLTKILKTPQKAKQNKKDVDIIDLDQARGHKELAKKQEPTKEQAKKQATAKTQSKKQEANTTRSKKQEIAKAQAKKQETPKTQSKKPETETKKQETDPKQSKKQEPDPKQSKKQEPDPKQSKKQEPDPKQSNNQETTKLQAKKQETTKSQPKKQETAKIKDKELQNKNKEIAIAKRSESKTAKDTKTPPKIKPKENETSKTQKNSRNKKIVLEDSYLTNSSLDNRTITRPIRTCRLNSSISSSNGISMTLRPRKTSAKMKCISLSCSRTSEKAM